MANDPDLKPGELKVLADQIAAGMAANINAVTKPAAQTLTDQVERHTSASEWVLRRLGEEFADVACARVSSAVVSKLKRLPGMMQDGSGLRSVWDETCAQVQGRGHIVDWDVTYIPTIERLIDLAIEKLSATEKRAVWLQTKEGDRWLDDINDDPEEAARFSVDSGVPVVKGETNYFLLEKVLGKASDYRNARISAFLDKSDEQYGLWE